MWVSGITGAAQGHHGARHKHARTLRLWYQLCPAFPVFHVVRSGKPHVIVPVHLIVCDSRQSGGSGSGSGNGSGTVSPGFPFFGVVNSCKDRLQLI